MVARAEGHVQRLSGNGDNSVKLQAVSNRPYLLRYVHTSNEDHVNMMQRCDASLRLDCSGMMVTTEYSRDYALRLPASMTVTPMDCMHG